MCFSASASFAASGILMALGSYALYHHHTKTTWMVATVPLFFGIQQGFEGLVWLSRSNAAAFPAALTALVPYCFLFFAYFIWPIWIPTAAARFEPTRNYRNYFLPLQIIGWVTSTTLLYIALEYGVTTTIEHHHIVYTIIALPRLIIPLGIGYVTATSLPFFISSRKYMPQFGCAMLASCALSYYAFFAAFTSVWCFFAALLSAMVIGILHVNKNA